MRPVFDPSAVHHLKHKGAVDADGHVLEDAGLWGPLYRGQVPRPCDFATFDRFPKLKLVLLESGAGWIGYWLDRLDGVATATFLGGRAPLKMKPSDYFRQVWISGDPDERTLPAMMKNYGADRFFWASDYPHPDHTGDYLQALEEMVDAVPAPARAGLLGGNVRQAFGF
jgi:uncharacterized protein